MVRRERSRTVKVGEKGANAEEGETPPEEAGLPNTVENEAVWRTLENASEGEKLKASQVSRRKGRKRRKTKRPTGFRYLLKG